MNRQSAGALLLVGGTQFALFLIISEAIYPNYNVSANVISDLGVWGKPSAAIFNPSVVVFGLTILIASYVIQKEYHKTWLSIIFGLAGIGAIGVGLFPENVLKIDGHAILHDISAVSAFFFGALAAVSSYKITRPPFRYFSVALGVVALASMILFAAKAQTNFLGLGIGGMERMIAYPTLLWTITLGVYLMQKDVH